MINIKGNRVAPLFPGTCQQTTCRNEGFGEEQISKSSFPGIIEKQSHHVKTAMTCEERNDTVDIKDFSHHGYNHERTSHTFTCSSGDVHTPYTGLSETCCHCTNHNNVDFEKDSRVAVTNMIPCPCNGLSTAQRGILRHPQRMVAVHQAGEHWTPEYLSHEKKEDLRKVQRIVKSKIRQMRQPENSKVPLCPSCQKLTVQVFSVPYQNQGGDDKSCWVSRHLTKIPLQIKPRQTSATSSLAAWADYLKCFVCACPRTQETALCRHYYALSMICWLAVILTIIIVIATTVHRV